MKFSIYLILIIAVSVVIGFTYKKEPLAKEITSTKAVREVLTGQKLVVVDLKPYKSKDSVNYTAELRSCFMVVSYESDPAKVLLDWTVCPDGKCPEAKLYYPEKDGYTELDNLINLKLKEKKQAKQVKVN